MKTQPICQTTPTWIRHRLQDRSALAPLTGQDWRALEAFLHLVALYGNSDETGRQCAVMGMACCVCAMQPTTRFLAKAGIPHVLDWSDEDRLWAQIETVALNTTAAVEMAVSS